MEGGQLAFYATVEDVDRDGLDGALSTAEKTNSHVLAPVR